MAAENLASKTVQDLLTKSIVKNFDEAMGALEVLNQCPGDTLGLLSTMVEHGMVKSFNDVQTFATRVSGVVSAPKSERPPLLPVVPQAPIAKAASSSIAAVTLPANARKEPRKVTMAPPVAPPGAETEGESGEGGEGVRRRRPPKTPGRIQYTDEGRVITARELGQEPAVPIKESVKPDEIICLEDGTPKQMLKRYLNTEFGMTVEEYILKWELPEDYPMTAANFSRQKSALASSLGLGKHKRVKADQVAEMA